MLASLECPRWARKSLAYGLVLVVCAAAQPGFAADPQAALPLTRLVMFTSGVGYFEHAGEVDGDVQVDLKFNVANINDLLKSMVPRDHGGQVSIVTYGSQDPITKTLQTFAIDLTNNPTLADLLGQARGEQVEIEAPNRVTGTILGVEKRRERVDDEVVENAYLNLFSDAGLQSLPLSSIARIRLVNPQLDSELRQALSLLAQARSNEKKTVSVRFAGRGKRPAQIGYIQQSPVWKTSYRLVLNDEAPPLLQGWAIVENTTEEDWKDVRLTLVSGRPISFVMDLYQPLYVNRPIVEPELFASLRPQVYGQDMQNRKLAADGLAMQEQMAAKATESDRSNLRRAAGAAPPAPAAAFGGYAADAEKRLSEFQLGVESVARAAEVGELFQYVINDPVDLPRQQSAMLPIVTGSVQGDKVSIYNPQVHARHPLNGLKLVNTSGVHLMQGPITVFDGGTYAGDAQIEDLAPGGERLISYAIDLQTEVTSTAANRPQQLTAIRIARGTVSTTHKQQRTRTYTVRNTGDSNKRVLVEQPLDANWKLVTPEKADEQSRNMYRFTVLAEPGKPAKLDVVEEQVSQQSVGISNLDDRVIAVYLRTPGVSDAVKEALQTVVARKQELAQVADRRRQFEQDLAAITADQTRIRENMPNLDRNSEIYRRYVKKLDEQESEVEKLRNAIAVTNAEITRLQQALDEYMLSINVE